MGTFGGGLYLERGGEPRLHFAPDERVQVPSLYDWPMIEGFAALTRVRRMRGQLDAPLSHDTLYHTTLGLLDVTSPTYQKPLDALAGCRS